MATAESVGFDGAMVAVLGVGFERVDVGGR